MAAPEDFARELGKWWDYYNSLYLRGALRPPVLRVAETAPLGAFARETRTLTISAAHLANDPWLGVMETLRHEMAHQYADEVLGAAGEPPHGPKFRAACQLLRVSPRACGEGHEVTHDTARSAGRSAVLDKVHKLLSLSSSPNEHEAELALRKARELLLRHNISAAELAGTRTFGVRRLGAGVGQAPGDDVRSTAPPAAGRVVRDRPDRGLDGDAQHAADRQHLEEGRPLGAGRDEAPELEATGEAGGAPGPEGHDP